MLRCREVAERATAYVEGDMPRFARWSMRLHLLMCHHCRRFVNQLRRSAELLREQAGARRQDAGGVDEKQIGEIVDRSVSSQKPRD